MKPILTDNHEFAEIIAAKAVYVDKTGILARLASGKMGSQFFISRPRRFGKSLMLSTLRYMFEGRRDLFKGLKIEKTRWNWSKTYPVIMLNMSKLKGPTPEILESNLYGSVKSIAERFELEIDWKKCPASGKAFAMVLEALYAKHGKFVVLVDEYDVPLQGFLGDPKNIHAVREIMHDFYVQLKNNVEAIRFLMITGVTKLTKLSLFSGLNNPTDLTMDEPLCAGLLGYTKDEIREFFGDRIAALAKKRKKTGETVLRELLNWYDSYRFCPESKIAVCNPISVGKALSNELLVSYWVKTASASLLVERMRALNATLADFDTAVVSRDELDVCDAIKIPLVPLAYQSGYLTIKGKSRTETDEYGYPKLILGIPNHEVHGALKGVFWKSLMQIEEKSFSALVHVAERQIAEGNVRDLLIKTLYQLYAKLPPTWTPKTEQDAKRYFLLFMEMAGAKMHAEEASALGFADAVVETKKGVWIMEFKFNRSAASAIRQIRERGYAESYRTSPVTLVGIKFDSARKNIDIPKFEPL